MVECRSWNDFTCSNPNFIGVFLALPLIYIAFLFEFALNEQPKSFSVLCILVTVFFLLSFWSYLAVVCSNPGQVPRYWPLYNRDPSERKFCLICHNFKPERSHHCSRCKQCVLNMDHHCPWINNCVGFSNRKFFILFLTYLVLTILLALVVMTIFEVEEIEQLISGRRAFDWHVGIRFTVMLFCIGLIVPLTLFWHMHVKMMIENTTTLETMVKQRRIKSASAQGEQLQELNPYNIGCWYNVTQVFGENILYWFIPIHQDYPLKGKGIFWDKVTKTQSITVKDSIRV